jgi:anhydro-N-acetylmuramic acid kinase
MQFVIGVRRGTSWEEVAAALVETGGRKNCIMTDMIEKYSEIYMGMADDLGGDSDAIKTREYADIANHCLHALPITSLRTSSFAEPLSGGVLTKPHRSAAEKIPA